MDLFEFAVDGYGEVVDLGFQITHARFKMVYLDAYESAETVEPFINTVDACINTIKPTIHSAEPFINSIDSLIDTIKPGVETRFQARLRLAEKLRDRLDRYGIFYLFSIHVKIILLYCSR